MTEPNEDKRSSQTKKKKKKRKIHWFRILFFFLLLCMIAGVAVAAGIWTSVSKDAPDIDSVDLDGYAVTSVVYDKDGEQIGTLHAGENRVPVEYNDISPYAVQALVAIEDQRFWTHNGIDPIRIVGALIADIKARAVVQGGSTITQQLVGLVYLDRNETSIERKIKEATLAMNVEKKYTKEEIITAYLNRAYMGGGSYGIEAAAEYFFAKHAGELNIQEAAMLAGCIQNPSKWNPLTFPENALYRRNLVIDQMLKCEFITAEEAAAAKASPIELSEKRVTVKTGGTLSPYQTYLDYIVEEAIEVLGLEENEKSLYTGGYMIYTTMDQSVQKQIESVYGNDKNFSNADVQSAMVVTEVGTGAVRGLIGGRHQQAARELNRAFQAFRQPGSSFKPVAVYGPAFEQGYGPGSVFDDYPKDYSGHVFHDSSRSYRGLTTIHQAIISSLNTVAVQVMEAAGVDKCYNFAKSLGFSKLSDSDRNLSTALGGLTRGVSPLEMAGAYGTFANKGVYVKPYGITKITDRNGKVIWEHKTEQKAVMTEQSAYLLTSCLNDAATKGTGSSAAIAGHPTAGKTGTTSENKDAWFAGYTRQYVAVVWVGYDQPKKLGNNAFGGTLCAPIFNKVMTSIHQGLPTLNFEQPSGIVSVTIDTKSGLLPSELTPAEYIGTELFNQKDVPTATSDVWQNAYVCGESGMVPTDACPTIGTRVALVRNVPWVPVDGYTPADASLEAINTCPIHQGAVSSVRLTASGQYGTLSGELHGVNLSWTAASSDAAPVYLIYRSLTADMEDGEEIGNTTELQFHDKNLIGGTTNYYKVVALNPATSEQLGVSRVLTVPGKQDVASEADSGETNSETQQPTPDNNTPATQQKPAQNNEQASQNNNKGISLSVSRSANGNALNWNAPGDGNYQYYVFRDGAQIGKDQVITNTGFTDSNATENDSHSYFIICVDADSHSEVARSNSAEIH